MYNFTSGRSAPNARTAIPESCGSLLRSCRNCLTTDLHSFRVLHWESQTYGTECPNCNLCQFKFDEDVSDAVRHTVSLEMRGRMGPSVKPRGAYRDYAPKPIRGSFRGKAKPR